MSDKIIKNMVTTQTANSGNGTLLLNYGAVSAGNYRIVGNVKATSVPPDQFSQITLVLKGDDIVYATKTLQSDNVPDVNFVSISASIYKNITLPAINLLQVQVVVNATSPASFDVNLCLLQPLPGDTILTNP